MAGQQVTHVLLVDDEPAICRALTLALTRAGCKVTAAMSGEYAASVVRKQHVDLVVLDLRIPDMRGDVFFELASAIQPHLRTGTIFTTGDISERAQELIHATKCPVLQKPFDLKDLTDWIHVAKTKQREQSA